MLLQAENNEFLHYALEFRSITYYVLLQNKVKIHFKFTNKFQLKMCIYNSKLVNNVCKLLLQLYKIFIE